MVDALRFRLGLVFGLKYLEHRAAQREQKQSFLAIFPRRIKQILAHRIAHPFSHKQTRT